MDLPTIFALVVAGCIGLYVLLDGFDLGVGILFPFADDEHERDLMMNSIAPIWDGNETWLVAGGTLLLAGFPIVYSTVLPALYIPVMVMLFALVGRGVAFEFRFKATRSRRIWDWSFAGGSMLAAFAQGIMLGAVIDGIRIADGRFAGGPFDWLTPLSIAAGLGLVAGYGLLGSTWLIAKTDGLTQAHGRRSARWLLIAMLGFIALVSLWTPYAYPAIAERWFSLPNLYFLIPVPLVTALLAFGLWRAIDGPREMVPFLCTVGLFLLSLLGLGISLWPYAIYPTVTIHQAAARPETLKFVGVGVLIVLPVVLAYTIYAYRVFRGKTPRDAGYH